MIRRYFDRLKTFLAGHKKITVAVGTILLIVLVIYFYLIQPALFLYGKTKTLPRSLRPVINALNRRDIRTLDFELKYFRREIVGINEAAVKIGSFSFLPFLGPYAADLTKASGAATEGYDLLTEMTTSLAPLLPNFAFEGWDPKQSFNIRGLNADQVARALPVFSRELPRYKDRFLSLAKKFASIDEGRYPENFRGKPIRKYLSYLSTASKIINSSFDDATILLELAPEIMGIGQPKNYWLIIQNDKELRPGGGLLGGYTFISIQNGKFGLIKSGDISFIDRITTKQRPLAPEAIVKYLGRYSLYLKDANFSPDFTVSAQALRDGWLNTPQAFGVDGVAVVDTQFIKSLLTIFGDLYLNENTVVNKDNIDKIMADFFSVVGDDTIKSRKYKDLTSIILNELLKKSFAYSSYNLKTFVDQINQQGLGKHFLFYSINPKLQNLAEKYNLSGQIKEFNGDYLHINNALLSLARINWNLGENVSKTVEVGPEKIMSNLSIEFEAVPENDPSGLTGVVNYVRIYVPQGSRLVESQGSPNGVRTGEELGKTVFSAPIKLEINKKMRLNIKYESPKSIIVRDGYKLLIQKQPGTQNFKYKVSLGNKSKEFELSQDTEINL